MLINKLKNLKILLGSICLLPNLIWANPTTSTPSSQPAQTDNKPVFIQSNTSDFNIKTHVTLYQGNVIATHGQSTVTGDQLTLIQNEKNQLVKIITQGNANNLATIVSKEDNQPAINATCNTIYYYPQQNLAVLVGQAIATQGLNQIHGPVLRYNVKSKTLYADQINGQNPFAFINSTQNDTSKDTTKQ